MPDDDANVTPTPTTSAAEGIVYSCSGDFYVTEAIRSARSSLRHNALPHLLFAGNAERTLAGIDTIQGLAIERFQPSANPYADKIANMCRSPFERTIFLDSDTFVVEEIAHVLRLLDRYDVAVAYAPAYRGLADPGVPHAFHEFNTGVMAWRSTECVAAFMRDWQETYLAWLDGEEPFPGAHKASQGGRADQPAFRHCAWRHDIRLHVLAPEYNFRLGYPATVVDRVRVIHGAHHDYHALAARLNERPLPRSWPPPLSLREKVIRRIRKAARVPSDQAPRRPIWRAYSPADHG